MRIKGLVGLFLSTTIFLGCASQETESEATVANSSPTQDESAANESGSASVSDTILIDVRSQAEWDEGHVEQAVHIPHTEIADRISEVTDDKSANIVVYCKSGGRAGTAKKALEELGFTSVENIGGLQDAQDRFAN